MDIFNNPDQMIEEVDQEEKRREDQADVEDELDKSPEDQDEDADG